MEEPSNKRNTDDVSDDINKERDEKEDTEGGSDKTEKNDSSSSVRIVDISHDTTRDSDNGDTFDCLESVNDDEATDDNCIVCGTVISDNSLHLLTCLHCACRTCTLFNSQTITCPRCKITSDTCNSVLIENSTSGVGEYDRGHVSECLLEMSREQLERKIPAEVSRLDNLLTDLQEENDNTRSLITETYQSYRYNPEIQMFLIILVIF